MYTYYISLARRTRIVKHLKRLSGLDINLGGLQLRRDQARGLLSCWNRVICLVFIVMSWVSFLIHLFSWITLRT